MSDQKYYANVAQVSAQKAPVKFGDVSIEELKKSFPADVDYKVPFESVSVVKVSIDDVVNTLLIALLLVTIVVFLFLQNWRSTLIPVLAIPVSIVGTFIFFIPLGFTINTFST